MFDVSIADRRVVGGEKVKEVTEVDRLPTGYERLRQVGRHMEGHMPHGTVTFGIQLWLDARNRELQNRCGAGVSGELAGECIDDTTTDIVANHMGRVQREPVDKAMDLPSEVHRGITIRARRRPSDTGEVDGND